MPTYTVGTGKTYSTIAAAIAAVPSNISGTGEHTILVDAGLYTIPSFSIPPKTGTSATDFIHLTCASGAEHKGNTTTGVRIQCSDHNVGGAIQLGQGHKISNVIVTSTSTGLDPYVIGPIVAGNGSVLTSTIENVIAIQAAPRNNGISTGNLYQFNIFKCIAMYSNGSANTGQGISTSSSAFFTHKVISCGSYNFGIGFFNDGSQSIVRNCWSVKRIGSSGSDFSVGSSSIISNNASSDSTATGVGSLPNIGAVANFGFLNVAGLNFHILSSSVLFNRGLNQSSLFIADIDNEVIGFWCIGPDCIFGEAYLPTSSSPWVNHNKAHRANQSAKAPSIKTSGGQKAPSFNHGKGQVGDAQDASVKEGNSETSASVNSHPIRANTRQRASKHAANIDGYISVIPNLSGYINPPVNVIGQRLQFEKENLTFGKEFPQLNSLGDHRTAMDRASLPVAPKGGFQFYPSSNDCIPTLMSHFQLRHGSNLAGGTTYYEFTPSSQRLSYSGSNFGTGTYGASSHSFFTVNVTKLVKGTGYEFKNGICDKLGFNFDVHNGFTLEPEFYFKSVSLAGSSALGSTGTYSSLPKFPGHSISATMFDQPVIGLQIYSDNALRPYSQSGTSVPYFGHGKYNIQGNATIDLSKVSLAYIGSMLGTQSFSIVGTLYNDERDKIVISLPNCFMDDFPLSMNSSTMDIPFRAYESENGGTAPMKVQIWTRNYSGTSFEPN